MDIGIVGAGVASAGASYVLDATLPEATLTVFEKSGGVCGRAATRRFENRTYDYGANYLKDDDPRVVDLVTENLDTEGLVSVDEPVYVFDETGTVAEGRDDDERKWSYRAGLTQLAKRLFDSTGARIHHHTRVETLRRENDGWHLVTADGESWPGFDLVLCTPPAPQTADLLRSAEWDSDRRWPLVDAVSDVPYRPIWTAVLGYEFELDVPYYALVNTDKNHAVGWISREECKPGHVPDGETLLIVQANREWSVEHADSDPAENVAELAAETAAIVDDERLASPAWSDHQYWRYALPERGVARGPVRSAEAEGLYCLGDWVAGEARMHAALRNGLDTGERIALKLG